MKLTNPKQTVITIENPLSGWIPQNGTANVPVEQGPAPLTALGTPESKSPGYSLSQFVDLFRQNFEGHISPGQAMLQLSDPGSGANVNNKYQAGTNVVNGLPVAVAALNGVFWTILNNFRVVQFLKSGISALSAGFDLPFSSGTLSLTNHSGHGPAQDNYGDLLPIVDSAGSPPNFLLYSWDDATDGDIGLARFNANNTISSNVPNWLSTLSGTNLLTTGVPHKMAKGSDGNVYVLNGQTVLQIVLAGGIHIYGTPVIAPTRLSFGSGWTATHLLNYQNFHK